MEAKYSYTSLKQSQRLLDIGFSRDTSDMYYTKNIKIPKIRLPKSFWHNYHKPCWSFRQLLYLANKIYPDFEFPLVIDTDIEYFVSFFERQANHLKIEFNNEEENI